MTLAYIKKDHLQLKYKPRVGGNIRGWEWVFLNRSKDGEGDIFWYRITKNKITVTDCVYSINNNGDSHVQMASLLVLAQELNDFNTFTVSLR